MNDPQPMTAPPQSRRWVWFFATLVLLAIAGITIPIVYNLRQQLKREDLDAAERLWQENGPQSYHLRYVVKKPNSEPETYRAEVRSGRVVAASLNGRPLDAERRAYRDMRYLFADIRGFLDQDAQPGKPRVFVTAHFDRKTGQLIRYVRSVTASRERVEIDVQELTPLPPKSPAAEAEP